MPQDVYGGTFRMLHKVFEPIGCIVKHVDFADLAAVRAALTPATSLVWLESPTNPRLLIYDIAAIAGSRTTPARSSSWTTRLRRRTFSSRSSWAPI